MEISIDNTEITILTEETVYEPREDSYLVVDNLLKVLTGESKDRILEVGCGTGIISLNAINQFPKSHYYATDINFDATQLTLKNMKKNNYDNLQIVCTDLFSCFRNGVQFSTIIFNPPYLPSDDLDYYLSNNEKLALVGGKTGVETTRRLIENTVGVGNRVLIIVSSNAIRLQDFGNSILPWKFELIDELKLNFEQLWLLLLFMEEEK